LVPTLKFWFCPFRTAILFS